jgi:hypothetical protein
MTKKYGMRGVCEYVLRIPCGKATIVCNFTNGNLQSRQPIPASMTTSNPIVQRVIEASEKFKNKKIFIMAEYKDSEPAPVVETKVETQKINIKKARKAAKSLNVMEDVATHADAVSALMAEGADISELKDVEACLRKAEELGISFPNLK